MQHRFIKRPCLEAESMDKTPLVTRAEHSAAGGSDAMAALVKLAPPDLFAALGHQVSEAARGAPGVTSFAVTVDLDELDRGVLTDLGKRIFARWNRTLHDFLCKASSEDQDLKSRVLQALSGKDVSASAILVGVLVGTFGLAPAVATIVSALVVKLVVQPAGDEICKFWDEQLAKA
jgi:hypothetical protein